MPFYQKGDVRIRYEETGSGFPLLLTPGGGLNSRVSNWPTAVFNAMEVFKNDFRCITMDQRNAIGGEFTGPIAVDDPWGAFADDQLGLMDHLGIKQFFFMGYCIGGCFAMKLMERAPDRVVAGVLCQTVGHWDDDPDVMYRSGHDVWGPELMKLRPDVTMETIEAYLHNLYRVRPTSFTASRATSRAAVRRRCWCCRMPRRRIRCRRRWTWRRWRRARGQRVPVAGAARTEGQDDRARAAVPSGASACAGCRGVRLAAAMVTARSPLVRTAGIQNITEENMVKYTWEHIHLRSPDPAATAQWYEDKLGADVIRTPQPDGSTRIDLSLTGQKIFIAKADPASTGGSPETPYMGLEHFGLTVEDMDAAVAELKAKGVAFTMEPKTIRPGVRIAFLTAPQNVSIELIQRG